MSEIKHEETNAIENLKKQQQRTVAAVDSSNIRRLTAAGLGYGRRHVDYSNYLKPKLNAGDAARYDSIPHPIRGSKENWRYIRRYYIVVCPVLHV
jgi:hypothetical protein